jgi:Mn2+/Fe2+ NRAMP family transporter
MPLPIPSLKEADLPARKKSLVKMMGPGIVMAGLAIGSGELIMWPWITSIVGAQLLWAAAIGIFLQLWINIEIGRWSIVTGESPFTGMVRVIKTIVYVWVFMIVVGKFLPGWARETGIALRDLIFGPGHSSPPWAWTALVFAAVAAILFGPKVIYKAVERSIMFLIVVIVVGLIYVVWEIGSMDLFMAMWDGVTNIFDFPDFPVPVFADDGSIRDELSFSRFFGAVVFAGAGGLGNLYYAYYLREKGIGMGARMPTLMSAAHKHETKEMDTGFLYPETEENQKRFRDWFRYVVTDQVLFFWLLGSVTMFLFIFGALAVLHPIGLVPDRGSLVWDLASILEESMGTSGRYIFLVVGMAALFSTQLGGVDGGSRIFSDLLHTNFKFGKWFKLEQWYLILVSTTMIIGTFSVWFFEQYDIAGLDFLFISALIGGFAMAVYVPLLLYMNLTYLPKSARPGWINIFFMVIASAMYIGFAGYTIYTKVVDVFFNSA